MPAELSSPDAGFTIKTTLLPTQLVSPGEGREFWNKLSWQIVSVQKCDVLGV